MASEHGVPVVFEPLGVDKESQQSFSKPNADTTTPAPSPDTPNQASKPEPPSPPNTTQVSDTPTSQTQTPYEDPEIAPSRPNIPLTPYSPLNSEEPVMPPDSAVPLQVYFGTWGGRGSCWPETAGCQEMAI